MRFALPLACAFTFCIVCFGNVDAILPFGYLLAEFLNDEGIPLTAKALLVLPFAATIFPSFVPRIVIRSALTIVGAALLGMLWAFGIVAFVIYPMPENQIPNWVPAITSIPFVLAMIGLMIYSIRTLMSARRKVSDDNARQQNLGS
jgi:hypothetical protein